MWCSFRRIWAFLRREWYVFVTVIVAVLLINSLYVLGYAVSDPALTRSGLAIAVEKGTLPGEYTIDPNDGFSSQALGSRVAKNVLNGENIWWNHYAAIGNPLVSGMQSGFIFPIQFLLLFNNGLLYVHMIFEIIGGICTVYFLRKIGCSKLSATVGGIAFASLGTFAWLANAAVNPIAFLPMLLLSIEFWRESYMKNSRTNIRGWGWIGVSVALSLIAGFPETGLLDTLFAFGWALARMSGLSKSQRLHFLGGIIKGGVLGLGLAAPLIIAFVGYVTTIDSGLHGSSEQMTLSLVGLGSLIMPYIFGPIGAAGHTYSQIASWWGGVGGYVPISIFFLAIVAFTTKTKLKNEKRFLIWWIVISLGITFGVLWLHVLFGILPIFSQIVMARYLPPTYEFAFIIAACIGIDALIKKGDTKKSIYWRPVIITFVIVGIVTLISILSLGQSLSRALKITIVVSLTWVIINIVTITVGRYLLVHKKARSGTICIVLMVVIDCLIMFMIPTFSANKQVVIDTAPVQFLRQNLKDGERFYTMGPIQPNYGTYYGIASININDLPQSSYATYIKEKLNPNSSSIVFNGSNPTDPSGILPKQAFLQNMKNYEDLSVRYVVTFPGLFTSEEIANSGITKVFQSPVAEIFELANSKPYVMALNNGCTTTIEDWDRVAADCQIATRVVRREQYAPGWSAFVDGKNVTLEKYDDIFQVITIPAGKHVVTYRYEPPLLTVAYVVQAVVVMIAITMVYRSRAKQ